ncbi:Carboxylesterase type B [Macrophomina phaseolina MS6]|uniref:Carboxylic ester hydrolase n=1 Tax=Macrophomina phaseolina (strain MS6) TaxID=1126212 RepID=K2RMH0_MACPH|nr:Carboxylesterase type B [Macrophomina phaseolina MS6]
MLGAQIQTSPSRPTSLLFRALLRRTPLLCASLVASRMPSLPWEPLASSPRSPRSPRTRSLTPPSSTVYTEFLPGYLLTPGQTQSEDCLTLNIWAPRALNASSELLPVMIWIHGGGFTGGGSASPYKYGTRIVKDHQDVIVVALNYRVNIFGFPNSAALGGEHLNPGLEDQRKAVEWVYENIHAFGGDADRMILFGQSAG